MGLIMRINIENEYNPFIHGTTSATLALLAKTDNQLMPILLMMDEYH